MTRHPIANSKTEAERLCEGAASDGVRTGRLPVAAVGVWASDPPVVDGGVSNGMSDSGDSAGETVEPDKIKKIGHII